MAKKSTKNTKRTKKTLTVASCQFPVSNNINRNAKNVIKFLHKAKDAGADLLHCSEACLSGYGGADFPSFEGYDWDLLRERTAEIQALCKELGMWLVLGSAHYLNEKLPPTNALYLINPQGKIVDRYDKCMLTGGDEKAYTAGNRYVVHKINGVKVGLLICYDVCFPQTYIINREMGAELILHSYYNGGPVKGRNCLAELNHHLMAGRCSDNGMWGVANNTSGYNSQWGGFVAAPDCTVTQNLPRRKPGMLIATFPAEIKRGNWTHNSMPMDFAKGTKMFRGKPSKHARQQDGKALP